MKPETLLGKLCVYESTYVGKRFAVVHTVIGEKRDTAVAGIFTYSIEDAYEWFSLISQKFKPGVIDWDTFDKMRRKVYAEFKTWDYNYMPVKSVTIVSRR